VIFLRTNGAEITMVLTGQELPSRADGSEFITLATFYICSGRNGGLESALWVMTATGVDCGVLAETKITYNIYTQFLLVYNVFSQTPSASGREGLPSSGGTMISTRLRSLRFAV
jgi:hypothetical protein